MRLKASTQVLNCDARDKTLVRTWALVKVGGVGGGVVGGVAAPLAAIAGRRGEEGALCAQGGGSGSESEEEEGRKQLSMRRRMIRVGTAAM